MESGESLLQKDTGPLDDAWEQAGKTWDGLRERITKELEAVIDTSRPSTEHHCQNVVSCIVTLNESLLQTYCENNHLYFLVRETIKEWAKENAEKQKKELLKYRTNIAPTPQDASSQELSSLRALESTMIMLYQCTEVIEWCYQQSVWSCWERKEDGKTLSQSIQQKYEVREGERRSRVEQFRKKALQAFSLPTAKRASRADATWIGGGAQNSEESQFVDVLTNWLVPPSEQQLLYKQLWPSGPPNLDDLFQLVCGRLFCLENEDAVKEDAGLDSRILDSKHAALRYLLYDVHHFTGVTDSSEKMMTSHRDVFEKMGERSSQCYYFLDECFSNDTQKDFHLPPFPMGCKNNPSSPMGADKSKHLYCAKLIRFEQFAASRDAAAVEGGLSDYLAWKEKGVEKGDPVTMLRQLANEYEAKGQIQESSECQQLACKYDVLSQVDRVWMLVRSLYYAGASPQVVASVLPRASSILSVSLQPADVLIAVLVLCNVNRVGDALSWVRLVRSSKVLSVSREDELEAALRQFPLWRGDGEDAGTLLGQIAMQMICQWCWTDLAVRDEAAAGDLANDDADMAVADEGAGPELASAEQTRLCELRRQRLGMLIRMLRPADGLVAANSSQLSWEESTVVHFLTTVSEEGYENMRQLGQDLAIVALFQRNKLGQLLERKEDHNENKAKRASLKISKEDTSKDWRIKTGDAADAIMDNLELVVPELPQECVENDLKAKQQAPKAWKVAATMGISEAEVPMAIEQAPMSAPKQPAAPIGNSPFVTALPNFPPVETATPAASRPALLPVPAFVAASTPVPSAPAVPTTAPLAHNSLLVALETPPPNSNFPRPDSSHVGLSTPMTPAFVGNPVPVPFSNPAWGKTPAPQPSPASSRRSRLVIRGRGSAQGRASIQSTRKNVEMSMPMTDDNNSNATEPSPAAGGPLFRGAPPASTDVDMQYVPAQGQTGKLSDPIGTPGGLTINMPQATQASGLASRTGLRSSIRPAAHGSPQVGLRSQSRQATPEVSSFISRTPAVAFGESQNAQELSPMRAGGLRFSPAPLTTPDLA